ncbi:MAG: LysR family transcriptional regulator [Lachnospiraceae bacterium]|nr:LysR family transcriptional regulator [Lachnospiraceae bacterium]
MRLEQLRYIVEIADTGSFTLASERLFIAQPSISQAVSALEKELNMTLFIRQRNGTVPTAAGLQVINHAREVLREVGEIEKLATSDFTQVTSLVSIGVIPTLSAYYLPEIVPDFQEIFPNVRIRIREEGTEKIIRECLSGEVHLGLVSVHGQRVFNEELLFQYLLETRLMAYVGNRSALVGRDTITFRELLPFRLFLFGDEFYLHRYLLNQISQYGEPQVMSTTHNPESIKQFVMRTDAVGFGPELSLKNDPFVREGSLHPIEITDAENVRFGLLTKKRRKPDVAADAFIRTILKHKNM